MQKARRRSLQSSDRLQTNGFRVYFTPLFGVLFTFPSQYWFTIGLLGVFSLTGWSPLIQTGFLVSRPTQDSATSHNSFLYGIVTLFDVSFQILPIRLMIRYRGPTTPTLPKQCRFGLFPFRSPLLGKSIFLSFPADTKMFQFSALAHSRVISLQLTGFPHSDTDGSFHVC